MGGPSAENGGIQNSPQIGAVKFDADGNLLTFDGTRWAPLEEAFDPPDGGVFRGAPEEPPEGYSAAGTDEPAS
jgi:hypothetical protein